MRKKGIYALYKGDDILIVGTKEELAKYLGVSVRTIEFYRTPSSRKRDKGNALVVIRVNGVS